MAKQRSAAPRASSKNRDKRSVSRGRTLQSEISTPQAEQNELPTKLTLRLRFFNSAVAEAGLDLAVDHPLPYRTLPPLVTTCNEQTIHKPQEVDATDGNEHADMMDVDGGREWASSVILPAQSPVSDDGSFKPIRGVLAILDKFQSTDKIHLNLPSLSHVDDADKTQPYSAQILTQLYITCYQRQLWNLCDMIADTWIRAFHARRKRSQTAPEHLIWRRNKALEERKRKAYEVWRTEGRFVPSEFDQEPRYYGLEVSDPDLALDVTDMHIALLNTLYEHTKSDSGACILWADALSLAGDHTEKSFEAAQKRGLYLHQDLLFNILQTSLRVVRRNLTLKIEESTEGAWCKRYHEHAKHGLPCYREVAAKSKEGDGDGQIQVGEEEYHEFMQKASREKAQRAQWLEAERRRATKHVSFGDDLVGDDLDTDTESVAE